MGENRVIEEGFLKGGEVRHVDRVRLDQVKGPISAGLRFDSQFAKEAFRRLNFLLS